MSRLQDYRPDTWGRIGALAAIVVILLGTVGCGESSRGSDDTNVSAGITHETAQQILTAAKTAVAQADSVTVRGVSKHRALTMLSLAMQLTRDAGQGAVKIVGMDFHVIRVGQDLYVKGSPGLYSRLGVMKQIPPDAWVRLPASNSVGAFTDLAGETSRIISSGGTVTKGSTTTIAGQPVIELKTEGKLYKGRLFIKATGEAYPIKLEKHGRETATFSFANWNATPAPTAPTTVVDAHA